MIFCTQLLPSWLLLSLFYKHFYEQFIFTPSTKPAASQTVHRCLLAGGKNIDTETETENQKKKTTRAEKQQQQQQQLQYRSWKFIVYTLKVCVKQRR